ncbi:hypothetical protein SAMN05216390_10349 [Lachnospiraceae bacterium KH1T2]|nr:hypothetical protein SAMN05216390_10349 [Lachnospiraceae bacterium KH1T2]
MYNLFKKAPLLVKLLWLSLELAIVLYAIFVGTTTTVLYQGF